MIFSQRTIYALLIGRFPITFLGEWVLMVRSSGFLSSNGLDNQAFEHDYGICGRTGSRVPMVSLETDADY